MILFDFLEVLGKSLKPEEPAPLETPSLNPNDEDYKNTERYRKLLELFGPDKEDLIYRLYNAN